MTVIASLSFAQSTDTFRISGIVISTISNKPIPEATIVFTRNKGVLTDSIGCFVIMGLSKGQHKLSFSALGFDNKDTVVTITDKSIKDFVLPICTNCYLFPQVNIELALKDIKEGNAKLLLSSGIAPIVYTTDKSFQKKYKVSYLDYGCDATVKEECMKLYNQTIFEYLDKTYGTKWRKEVRQDVIGLHDK